MLWKKDANIMHRIDNVCAGERMRQPYSFLIGKIKQEQTRTCQTLVKKKTTKRKIVVFNIIIMQGVYKNHKLVTITRSKIANGTIKITKCDIQKNHKMYLNFSDLTTYENIISLPSVFVVTVTGQFVTENLLYNCTVFFFWYLLLYLNFL